MEMTGESTVPLKVENVQALASNNLKTIPHRYIRPELELEIALINENAEASSSQVPVIDLSRLTDDEQFSQEEMAKFHFACQEWGFFQLVNHGVAEDVMEKMIRDVSEFFKLPFEEKKACSQDADQMEGYGQSFVFSEEQKLDWGDMLYLFTQPLPSRKFKFWPSSPLTFRETVDRYLSEMERIKTSLVGLMGKNLGINQEKFINIFNNGYQTMRFNYYPPCPQASKVLGISPHSDATGLTVLLQLNQVQGLQIRHDGQWVPVNILPHALLVNIGDVLEILSNGRYKSIEHRVVIDKEKERMSVAVFHETNESAEIGPLPELFLINEGETNKYRSISFEGFVNLLSTRKLDGKSLVDAMKLKK